MTKLKTCICANNKVYTLKDICPKCNKPTTSAHYKFIKIKDAVKSEN